mgnify:CR=1 FL=1
MQGKGKKENPKGSFAKCLGLGFQAGVEIVFQEVSCRLYNVSRPLPDMRTEPSYFQRTIKLTGLKGYFTFPIVPLCGVLAK